MKIQPGPGVDRLELLQTFARIVETGSLSAAAAQMGMTQPTVSRRLQQLERSLGLRLLQRSTHAMKLTEDGERCFAHARNLLESWQAIEADLNGTKEEPRGTLRIVAPHAFGQDQLIGPLAEFLRLYPKVTIEWSLHDHRLPDFIPEGVDCALRVGAVEDPNLVAIRIADVPRIVVAAPGLWGDGPPPDAVDALASLPWVALTMFYRNELTLQHAQDGREHRLVIQPRMSTDSLNAMRNAILRGIGAGLASSWIVAEDLAVGRLVQLAPQWAAAPLPMHLIYPHARLYPARLRAFTQFMRDRVPRLTGLVPIAGR